MKAEYEFISIEGYVFLTQHPLLGNHHAERARWQGASTRRGCKTTEDPDHTTFICQFSALRHIKMHIKMKLPQGTGLPRGGCPHPGDHQVLLSPTPLLFSIAGQPHGQAEEMGAGGGEGTHSRRPPQVCVFPGIRREGEVSDQQAERKATRLGKGRKSGSWPRRPPSSSPPSK